MRRLALTTAGLAAVVTLGVSGGLTGVASAATIHVKPGSMWTVEENGDFCQVETFDTGNTFTADTPGEVGNYTGGARSVMLHWTTGPTGGLSFSGKWHRTTKSYVGSLTSAAIGTKSAQLVKGVVTTWNQFPC